MSAAPVPWKHIRNVLVLFAPLWLGAMAIFGALGIMFALFQSDTFSARQPLVVRNEATSSFDHLGRFASQTDLKAAQETILEMTKNPEVVAGALRELGPPSGSSWENWPNTETIDSIAKNAVNLVAPQGSEFGNTEVVYLQVKADDQKRAVEFCNSLFSNLTEHLRNIRRVRADSVVAELTFARDLARQNLEDAASRIREYEMRFAADLGDLRNLNDTISGDGTNRKALAQTVTELLTAEIELEKLESLKALLTEGAKDPDHLLVSGSDLLTLQPSLLRLKDGLVDAQIASSQLAANRSASHPTVINARAAENEIRGRMQDEAASIVKAMEQTLALSRGRVKKLDAKKQELSSRLSALAEARTDYAKVDAEVNLRTQLLAEAEKELADAVASRTAAVSTNLVAKLGPPQVSDKPLGPGGMLITLASSSAGLLFGLGTVFLVAPGPTESRNGRRWSDYLQRGGRRQCDVAGATPPNPQVATTGPGRRQSDRTGKAS